MGTTKRLLSILLSAAMTLSVASVAAFATTSPTVEANFAALTGGSVTVNAEYDFGVTTKGTYSDGNVYGDFTVKKLNGGSAALGTDFTLKYKNESGSFVNMPSNYFGPGAGFPFADNVTSQFKVTFLNADTYSVVINIKNKSTDTIVCKTAEQNIVVNEAVPPVTKHTITLSVTPSEATVVLTDSQSAPVAAETNGSYKVEAGTYNYTVSYEGYVTQTGEIVVTDSDVSKAITLVAEQPPVTKHTITLSVTPSEATVVLTDSQSAPVAAETNGSYKVEAGTYNYTVSYEGYATQTGEIVVSDSDVSKAITLVAEQPGGGADVTSVTLPATKKVAVGKTLTLTPTYNENAVAKSVEWKSLNESIATVSEAGVVTGVAEGEAVITVKIDGKEDLTASCTVTVAAEPEKPDPEPADGDDGDAGEPSEEEVAHTEAVAEAANTVTEAVATVNNVIDELSASAPSSVTVIGEVKAVAANSPAAADLKAAAKEAGLEVATFDYNGTEVVAPVVELDATKMMNIPWSLADSLAGKNLIVKLTGNENAAQIFGAMIKKTPANRVYFSIEDFVKLYGMGK